MINDDELQKLKADLTEIFTSDPKELQKKYQAEHEAKLNKKLAPFMYLWKKDNTEWMRQRREDWKIIEAEYLAEEWSKAEVGRCKRYFLNGVKKEYMPGVTLFFLTPIDSPETALKFFLSLNFDDSMRDHIYSSYFRTTSKNIGQLRFLRPMIKYFVSGVLGSEYRQKIIDPESGYEYNFPEPTFWCQCFLTDAKRILNGDIEYQGVVESLDYFVSCLSHAKKIRKAYVDDVLKLSQSGLQSQSEVIKKFSEEIQEHKDKIANEISNIPDSHKWFSFIA